MSTHPYVRFPKLVRDDDDDTAVVERVDEDGPTNEPFRPVTPLVKPRALYGAAAEMQVRPVGQGGHGSTLVGMQTSTGQVARTRPPTMQQVMQPMPALPAPAPLTERSRIRAMGTPSPVPLFGTSQPQRVTPRSTGIAQPPPAMQPQPMMQAQPQAQETILMPHAEHDAQLQATIAMMQASQPAPVAVLQGQPYVVQAAQPARGVIVEGEIAHKPSANSKFAEYEQIGLPNPQPSKAAKAGAKLVVSTYRLMGFAILTIIVAVLIGYITTTAFYFVSHTWIVPTIVSPSDDKVVQLRTELAAQQNVRDKLESDLHESERAAAAEGEFQKEFADAIQADLDGRKVALGRVQALAGAAYATRQKISTTNDTYAKQLAAKSQQELDAGLIDRDHAMSNNFTEAQISDAQLRLQTSEVQFEQQAAELKQQTDALDALLTGPSADGKKKALSYDVLKIKRDYDASKLALAKALETHKMLAASLAREDEILAGLKQSAYLRALDDKATVALVPYGNLENAKVGTPLYACNVGMVMCREVGTVEAILPGEIQFKNPHRDTQVRGQMVELQMTDSDAATDEVLFVGGEPLGF